MQPILQAPWRVLHDAANVQPILQAPGQALCLLTKLLHLKCVSHGAYRTANLGCTNTGWQTPHTRTQGSYHATCTVPHITQGTATTPPHPSQPNLTLATVFPGEGRQDRPRWKGVEQKHRRTGAFNENGVTAEKQTAVRKRLALEKPRI